jgi:hypothetical protein
MKTKRQDATADCNAYCDPLMIRQFLHKTSGPNSGAFTTANNTDSPIQKVEVHNSMGQHVHTVNGGFSSIQLPIHLQGSLALSSDLYGDGSSREKGGRREQLILLTLVTQPHHRTVTAQTAHLSTGAVRYFD